MLGNVVSLSWSFALNGERLLANAGAGGREVLERGSKLGWEGVSQGGREGVRQGRCETGRE